MYNEQIEQLINAALADGVLTEKEKQVLFKKAESMGIDLDEFEMVLSSKLYDKQKAMEEERKKKSDAAPKSNKMGDVRKCPACGAIVSSFAVKCLDCGYEFSDVNVVSSMQRLNDMLNEVSQKIERRDFKNIYNNKGEVSESRSEQYENAVKEEQVRIIESFPIPSSKGDLFEFASALAPFGLRKYSSIALFTNFTELEEVKVKKFEECIAKIKMLFPDDKMFEPLFNDINEAKKKRIKIICLIVSAFIGCWIISALLKLFGM